MEQWPASQAPGVLSLEALMAIDVIIVMGAQADPELLKADRRPPRGADAETAYAGFLVLKVDLKPLVNGADAKSVPESTVMDCHERSGRPKAAEEGSQRPLQDHWQHQRPH